MSPTVFNTVSCVLILTALMLTLGRIAAVRGSKNRGLVDSIVKPLWFISLVAVVMLVMNIGLIAVLTLVGVGRGDATFVAILLDDVAALAWMMLLFARGKRPA